VVSQIVNVGVATVQKGGDRWSACYGARTGKEWPENGLRSIENRKKQENG